MSGRMTVLRLLCLKQGTEPATCKGTLVVWYSTCWKPSVDEESGLLLSRYMNLSMHGPFSWDKTAVVCVASNVPVSCE